ncbi:MAG: glycosyltransferase [Cellvibrionaceae bacterium]
MVQSIVIHAGDTLELVTVITANYNGRQYIARAIESVLNQTYQNIEYFIVDDGSTDDSAEIIKQFGRKDSRIKALFLPNNRGVAQARNAGIENSTGEYITFLDADDIWAPEKIEKQVAVFRQRPKAGLVVTDAALIDENDQIINNKKNRKKAKEGAVSLYDYISGKCHLSINAMTRRECLQTSGLFNPAYIIGEDYELWMRITREYEYYYLKQPLHCYRIHADNATRDKLFNRQSKIKILEEMVDNNPELLHELGRGFNVIMQRKYNSLGKAYYFADRSTEAEECFRKTLDMRGSILQRLKARFWCLVLKSRQSSPAL